MEIFYGKSEKLDFEDLIYQIDGKEFSKKLTRSTIPLLSYWRNYNKAINKLCKKINIDYTENSKLCFEYPVKSYKGNKPSFTDIMYISKNGIIAIEGKWTESNSNSIEKWLKQGKSIENRNNVLSYWISIINNYSSNRNDLQSFPRDIEYQVLHRIASACSFNEKKVRVVYQIFFSNKRKSNYKKHKEKLKYLYNTIKPVKRLELWLWRINVEETTEFESAFEEHISTKDIDERISIGMRVILNKKLFNFKEEAFEKIS